MADFYWATEAVGPLGADLIERHHQHLRGIRIEYVWRSPAALRGGKVTLGKARKITGLNALLAGHGQTAVEFFVIELAAEEWEMLTAHQRAALVDHELNHCFVDAEGKLSLVPHDVEEFGVIVRRYGTWSPDLMAFAEALQGSPV